MTRTALVAGATGLIGHHLLRQLLADPRYTQIRALARRELPLHDARLQTLLSDGADLRPLGDALRADDVYCALGTTLRKAGSREAFEAVDLHMVVRLARAARAAGAQRFIVISAAGASERSPAYYSRVKGRMEREVAALDYAAVHILRPSLLLGDRAEHRPGEAFAQKLAPLMNALLRGPLRKYQAIDAEAVASAMIEVAWRKDRGVERHDLPLADR